MANCRDRATAHLYVIPLIQMRLFVQPRVFLLKSLASPLSETDNPVMSKDHELDERQPPNPYQTPQSSEPPWFRWARVPYGLLCAYRAYTDQMQKDGHTLPGHMLCWLAIAACGFTFFLIVFSAAYHFFDVFSQW